MEPLTVNRSISTDSLFSNFFEVAEFQREYVWATDDVSDLLDGIWKSYKEKSDQQYFIGSIVLATISNNAFKIVDGQQRITTLFLILCAMKARIKDFDKNSQEIALIDNKLRDFYLGKSGATKEFRLKSLNTSSQNILNAAFEGKPINIETNDESSQHLKEAYNTCTDFYAVKINDKFEAIGFLQYILHQVCVLPYVAASMNHALTVFETLNSTGVGLTPIDLVKNIIFKSTEQTSWEDLQEKWKDFVNILEKTGELPQRFLKYFILVTYGKTSIESEIFDWIRANEEQTKINKDPFGFLSQLTNFAASYLNIINGKSADGSENPYVANLRKLAGRARQHFPFLIAIKNFSKDMEDKFIFATESLLMAYGIQRMYTGDIESTFSNWTLEAINCESKKQIDSFYQTKVEPELKRVGSSAQEKLAGLSEFSIAKQKLVYLLCRLDSFLQTSIESSSIYRDISNSYKGFDIEHILSQSEQDYSKLNFESKESLEEYKHKLGNLTILEKALNRAIQDKSFLDKKAAGYQHSNYILTKGIATSLPGKSQYAKALANVKTFEKWDKNSIDDRQRNLSEIAASAFGWK